MKEDFDRWLKNFVLSPDLIIEDENDIIIHLFKLEKNFDLLEYVIKSDEYDINYSDRCGVTPFHVICGGDRSDSDVKKLVKTLFNFNAEPDVVDNFGRTPLILAMETGKYLTAEELIHQGASVDTLKNSSFSPLIHAIKVSADHLAVLLVRAGANINELTGGETPLSVAKDYKNYFIEGFLQGKGAIEMCYSSEGESVDSDLKDKTWF